MAAFGNIFLALRQRMPCYGNSTGPMTFWLARCMETSLLPMNRSQFRSSSFHFGRISKSDRRRPSGLRRP